MGKDIELRRDEIKVSAFGEVGQKPRGRDRTGVYGWLTDTAHNDWRDTLVSAQCNTSFSLLINGITLGFLPHL